MTNTSVGLVRHVEATLAGERSRFRIGKTMLDVLDGGERPASTIFDDLLSRRWRHGDIRAVLLAAHPKGPAATSAIERHLDLVPPVISAALAARILEATLIGIEPDRADFDATATSDGADE